MVIYKIKLTNKSFSVLKINKRLFMKEEKQRLFLKKSTINTYSVIINIVILCVDVALYLEIHPKLSKQNFPAGLAKRAETLLPCYTALVLVVFCYY